MIKRLSTLFFLFTAGLTLSAQTVIFTDPGTSYTNSDGPTKNIYGPVDVSQCSSLSFSVHYAFSLPWEDSKNMEKADECGDCTGQPENQNEDCNGLGSMVQGCWDFFYVKLILDGKVIFTDLIGDSETTDDEQEGIIHFTYPLTGESDLKIIILTQTWAENETIDFKDIKVSCVDLQSENTSTSSRSHILCYPPHGNVDIQLVKVIQVKSRDLDLILWDDNIIDGDTISLRAGNEWILTNYPITKERKELHYVLKGAGINLILYAHNNGLIPPNTAALVIDDGVKRYRLRLSSDLTTAESVLIQYEK